MPRTPFLTWPSARFGPWRFGLNYFDDTPYWNPQQVERLLDALAALGIRRAGVAALIMWRSGLRVGETVALEWRDIDVTAGTLLVRRGKGGRGRTVPLHPDLASLFAN